MTNLEKIKHILDAGHWVKATNKKFTITITSYNKNEFTYLHDGKIHISTGNFNNYIIEVIQRIPTPYKSGDKVLVLSNPHHISRIKERMVWTVCKVKDYLSGTDYKVFNEDGEWFNFPAHCLAPEFDDEEISDTNRIISGKEAKIVIDGKEYIATLKLI